MVLSGGRLAKETNNDGGVKDFTVTPITDEDDKIHNAQDVNVANTGDDALATAANQSTIINTGIPITSFPALSSSTDSIEAVNKPASSLGHGVKTVTTAGTDVALATSTPCKYVIIQAQTDNTSNIAVGSSGVDATIATGTGIILEPGDSVSLDVDDLADVYIDSLVNGEGVRFTYGVA